MRIQHLALWSVLASCAACGSAKQTTSPLTDTPTSEVAMSDTTEQSVDLADLGLGIATGGDLHLRPTNTEVNQGESVDLIVDNVGADDFSFHHEGGSNSCHRFRWVVTLVHEDGRVFTDTGPNPGCAMAIVGPSDVRVVAGSSFTIPVHSGHIWYTMTPSGSEAQSEPMLPKGRYTVNISGGFRTVSGELVVV